MGQDVITEHIVYRINQGEEAAFSLLYKTYYTYLNAVAIYYLFDKDACSEVVDDVFMQVWYKRESLRFPVLPYLVRSVQNVCLNYIRMGKSRQQMLEKYTDEFTLFQEAQIFSTPVPLEYMEMKETEQEIRKAVDQLPERCRQLFTAYFYEGKRVEDIAEEYHLTISTVRVQLKNANDRLKQSLGHLLPLLFLFMSD